MKILLVIGDDFREYCLVEPLYDDIQQLANKSQLTIIKTSKYTHIEIIKNCKIISEYGGLNTDDFDILWIIGKHLNMKHLINNFKKDVLIQNGECDDYDREVYYINGDFFNVVRNLISKV